LVQTERPTFSHAQIIGYAIADCNEIIGYAAFLLQRGKGTIEPMETIAEVVSHNMRALRKKLGITQAELAERSGLSTTTVQQIERGETWLGKVTIEALSRGFGVSEIALFQSVPLDHPVSECARRVFVELNPEVEKGGLQTLEQVRRELNPSDPAASPEEK
jgi:transcriptional regulator with XRE-family HTH domain